MKEHLIQLHIKSEMSLDTLIKNFPPTVLVKNTEVAPMKRGSRLDVVYVVNCNSRQADHLRDILVHLREWLSSHRQVHTQHFGDSDQSGHPHGYAGVVIPEWDLRQKLDEIQKSLGASE